MVSCGRIAGRCTPPGDAGSIPDDGFNDREETRNGGAAVVSEHAAARPPIRIGRLRRASWVAAVAVLSLGAGVCQADGLTDKVLRALRSEAPEIGVTVVTDNELKIASKSASTVYLFNVRKSCESRADRCDEEVANFVRGVVSVASVDSAQRAFVGEKVFPVLRRSGFGTRATERIKEPDKQLVVMPFAESIETLFVVDSEKTVRFINLDDMAKAGLTVATLADLASRNAARLPVLKAEPIKGMEGVHFMPANDGLGSSRVFDPALWIKLEALAGGPVALAVPTGDWIFFTRADQPDQVAKLRGLVARVVRGEPYSVSDAVLVRDRGGWKALRTQ